MRKLLLPTLVVVLSLSVMAMRLPDDGSPGPQPPAGQQAAAITADAWTTVRHVYCMPVIPRWGTVRHPRYIPTAPRWSTTRQPCPVN